MAKEDTIKDISTAKLTTIQIKSGNEKVVEVINQLLLPHKLEMHELHTYLDAEYAIKEMIVRGAPLIALTALYGIYLASLENPSIPFLIEVANRLKEARPTAVNLHRIMTVVPMFLEDLKNDFPNPADYPKEILEFCEDVRQNDIEDCFKIGNYGLEILKKLYAKKNSTINILTHCNAGWLGCVDWGTATSPIYQAHEAGIPLHVYVDETRPRNQGFSLTAWELSQRGIPHTCIVDNTGGHLMQHKMVDVCFVGTDRTTMNGDVANKIGTYLKALAAKDNFIPFYACVPTSSVDMDIYDGKTEIPIEMRSEREVKYIQGLDNEGVLREVLLTPIDSPAVNYGFDVTPARLITSIITEYGVFEPSRKGMSALKKEIFG